MLFKAFEKIVVVFKAAIMTDGGDRLVCGDDLVRCFLQAHFNDLLRKGDPVYTVQDSIDLPHGNIELFRQILCRGICQKIAPKKAVYSRALIAAASIFKRFFGKDRNLFFFREPYKLGQYQQTKSLQIINISVLFLVDLVKDLSEIGEEYRSFIVNVACFVQQPNDIVIELFLMAFRGGIVGLLDIKAQIELTGFLVDHKLILTVVFKRMHQQKIVAGNMIHLVFNDLLTIAGFYITQFIVVVIMRG